MCAPRRDFGTAWGVVLGLLWVFKHHAADLKSRRAPLPSLSAKAVTAASLRRAPAADAVSASPSRGGK